MGLLDKVFGKHEPSTLHILCVSDIHLKVDHLQAVKDALNRKNINIDVALLSGDICNLKGEQYEDKEAIIQAENDIQNILWSLEQITSKVYYIPGNHDPKTTFDPKPQLTKNAKNVHKEIVEIVPDLFIAGFGGSIPSYYAPELRKKAWEGYPFTEEEQFEVEWNQFLNEKILPHNTRVLLMTHVGPSGSDTVRYQTSVEEKIILSGSDSLEKSFRTQQVQEKVLLNVHGHTHIGLGQTQYVHFPIINPGSLKEGNYAIITLEKTDKDWFIESTQFLHFNVPE